MKQDWQNVDNMKLGDRSMEVQYNILSTFVC